MTQASTPNAVMEATMAQATEAAKGKKENYSEETTSKLLEAWEKSTQDQDAVASLATMFGKTTKSIVAKLSREKVYKKQEYKTKTGEKPVSKEDHVANIATLLNVDLETIESLTKANKNVLALVEGGLQHLSELAGIDTQEEIV